jgi:hypothetical protein
MTLKPNQSDNLGLKAGKAGTYIIITEPKSGARFTVAKIMAPQFKGFLNDICEYVTLNKTDVGSYCYRYVRGSTKTLSEHSWANAIDILVAQNPMGQLHSKFGKLTDAQVIEIAEKWGLCSGGTYKSRKDWMHFSGSIFIPVDKLPNPVDLSDAEPTEVIELPLIDPEQA